jgi:hypothetical protein
MNEENMSVSTVNLSRKILDVVFNHVGDDDGVVSKNVVLCALAGTLAILMKDSDVPHEITLKLFSKHVMELIAIAKDNE